MTLEASNGGDDRGRAQRPASHRKDYYRDDADEAVVTRIFARVALGPVGVFQPTTHERIRI